VLLSGGIGMKEKMIFNNPSFPNGLRKEFRGVANVLRWASSSPLVPTR
jgi:hypothetical protein